MVWKIEKGISTPYEAYFHSIHESTILLHEFEFSQVGARPQDLRKRRKKRRMGNLRPTLRIALLIDTHPHLGQHAHSSSSDNIRPTISEIQYFFLSLSRSVDFSFEGQSDVPSAQKCLRGYLVISKCSLSLYNSFGQHDRSRQPRFIYPYLSPTPSQNHCPQKPFLMKKKLNNWENTYEGRLKMVLYHWRVRNESLESLRNIENRRKR